MHACTHTLYINIYISIHECILDTHMHSIMHVYQHTYMISVFWMSKFPYFLNFHKSGNMEIHPYVTYQFVSAEQNTNRLSIFQICQYSPFAGYILLPFISESSFM